MHHSHSKRIHRCHHQVNSTWKCPWKINIFGETLLLSTFLTLQLWQLRSSWRERQREADADLRSNLPSCNLAYWGSQPSAGRIWIIMTCDITGKNCSWTYCDIIRRMAQENVFPEQEEGHWLRGRTAWRHILWKVNIWKCLGTHCTTLLWLPMVRSEWPCTGLMHHVQISSPEIYQCVSSLVLQDKRSQLLPDTLFKYQF